MMSDRLRQRDAVARVASDQFVIILDNCGTDEAVTVAPFIEDDTTLRKVRELGLHFGQGYRLTSPELLNKLAPPSQPGNRGGIFRARG